MQLNRSMDGSIVSPRRSFGNTCIRLTHSFMSTYVNCSVSRHSRHDTHYPRPSTDHNGLHDGRIQDLSIIMDQIQLNSMLHGSSMFNVVFVPIGAQEAFSHCSLCRRRYVQIGPENVGRVWVPHTQVPSHDTANSATAWFAAHAPHINDDKGFLCDLAVFSLNLPATPNLLSNLYHHPNPISTPPRLIQEPILGTERRRRPLTRLSSSCHQAGYSRFALGGLGILPTHHPNATT